MSQSATFVTFPCWGTLREACGSKALEVSLEEVQLEVSKSLDVGGTTAAASRSVPVRHPLHFLGPAGKDPNDGWK